VRLPALDQGDAPTDMPGMIANISYTRRFTITPIQKKILLPISVVCGEYTITVIRKKYFRGLCMFQ
jgi:hypothetical protein